MKGTSSYLNKPIRSEAEYAETLRTNPGQIGQERTARLRLNAATPEMHQFIRDVLILLDTWDSPHVEFGLESWDRDQRAIAFERARNRASALIDKATK